MDAKSYEIFSEQAEMTTKKGTFLKFQRCKRNLKFNSEGIYNDDVKIANLDLQGKTIQRGGVWSSSNFTYYYYAKGLLVMWYDFTEIPNSDFKIPSLSYDDHT